MTTRFFLTGGEELPLLNGLPVHYPGTVLKGAVAQHIVEDFGFIVIQEVNIDNIILRHVLIRWSHPADIIYQHHEGKGLFCRAMLKNNLHSFVKGAGEWHLRQHQFRGLIADGVTETLVAEKPADYEFFESHYPAAIAKDMDAELANVHAGIPDKVTGPNRQLTPQIHAIIDHLLHNDYSNVDNDIRQQLAISYNLQITELKYYQYTSLGIKKADWELIQKVILMIEKDLVAHVTIPELSRMAGINEFKLKKLFPLITGFTIDGFRKYRLFIKARNDILSGEDPIKCYYEKIGYSSLSAFIAGFRNYLCCTPGELRRL